MPETNKDILTEKQRQVYELNKQGFNQTEIAEQLGISQKGVSQHLRASARKIGWDKVVRYNKRCPNCNWKLKRTDVTYLRPIKEGLTFYCKRCRVYYSPDLQKSNSQRNYDIQEDGERHLLSRFLRRGFN